MTATIDLDSIDLYDPDGYVDGPPHEVFEQLRRDAARLLAGRCPTSPGYWAVLKHADVVHVAREPKLFSAERSAASCSRTSPPERSR